MTNRLVSQSKWPITEADAILRAQEGDAGAFEYLYISYRKHVYSLCLRMLKNSAEAEDLTQETFLRIFRKIGTFGGESAFSTWVYKVTVNVVLMHFRRKKPAQVLAEDLDSASANTEGPFERGAEDTSLRSAIDRLNLRRALHKLPSGYRKYFLLYDVFGYKHAEIARILRCSVGCSKSQLHKARKRLRPLLLGKVCPSRTEA